MSLRVIAAAIITVAALMISTCATAVAATSRAARPAVQLTGVQLLSALLPRSDFPAGFKLDKSAVFDSGRYLEHSPAQYHLSAMSCNSFANNYGETGFGETATAADDFLNSTNLEGFGQQVYQFKTSRAAIAFFKGLRAISRRCRAFLLSGIGSDVFTHAFDAPSIGGHRTFQVNQRGSLLGVLTALDEVFTVAGTDVYFTVNIGFAVAPPSSPSARTSMLRLIRRVQAHP
ncbi:MAG TPA: hypothetical protein VED20_10180 [Streptosporangiaceae bacterium]|nr:hypothetical protein [Streptosporangiaceae bacterium]